MRRVLEAAWVERRLYVFVTVAIVAGLSSFLVGRAVFARPEPTLPPQRALATTLPTTTATAAASGASSRELPSAPPDTEEEADDRLLPSALRELDAGCADATILSPPAADLRTIVDESPVGTCFVLQPGRYSFEGVVPKDHMTFLGDSRSGVVVAGSDATENAFSGTAHGVTIGRMTFTGFRGNAGEKPQEQAPIRGTAGIWLSDRGQLATDWLIEDVEASDNLANGVFIGDHFTVRSSTFTDNGVTGIGGSEFVGGLVENNIVHGNGADQATGALQNGAGMKFTRAGIPEAPVVVRSNEVFQNNSIGIWCDIACDGFHVLDNYVHDQESRGIMFELSRNAIIRNNLLVDSNRWTDFTRDFNAGAITIGESAQVLVEANYIEDAEAGVVIRQTRRPALPGEAFLENYEGVNYVATDISIVNNTIVDTRAMGVSTGASGRGIIRDFESIRFESNTYGNPQSMTFWWENGSRYGFDQWRDSGRDLGGVSPVPGRPEWSMTPSEAPELAGG